MGKAAKDLQNWKAPLAMTPFMPSCSISTTTILSIFLKQVCPSSSNYKTGQRCRRVKDAIINVLYKKAGAVELQQIQGHLVAAARMATRPRQDYHQPPECILPSQRHHLGLAVRVPTRSIHGMQLFVVSSSSRSWWGRGGRYRSTCASSNCKTCD